MSINSVSSKVQNNPAVQSKTQPIHAKEVKNHNDKGDGATKAAAPPPAPPRPSVNGSGQVVGGTINTKA